MTHVFFHGFAGHPDVFEPLRRELGLSHVFSPTLAGHGLNPPIECGNCFEDEADRLAELVRARFPERRVDLWGYSLGARLGLALVLRHPDLIRSVNWFGVHPGIESEDERIARRRSDEEWARVLETQSMSTFADRWRRQPIFAGEDRLPESIRRKIHAMRSAHDPKSLARAMRLLSLAEMPNYWPRLSELSLPVKLWVGAEDSRFVTIAERVQRNVRNARIEYVKGAGHNLLFEAPVVISNRIKGERYESSELRLAARI